MPDCICDACHALIDSPRKNQRFCNDKCRNNYHNDRLRGYSEEVKRLEEELKNKIEIPKTLKCPHCNTDSSQPNMIEQISPTQYLCICCSKVSEITLK